MRREKENSEIGRLLRFWRTARGKSQYDVALDTTISQRHISFIEGGRSIPSREVLMRLANSLDIPMRERNELLLVCGYAPMYADTPLEAPQMQAIVEALRRALRQQEPFPALVMDRYWNVVLANDAAPAFFGKFIDLQAFPKPRNLLHLMFDPSAMRPFIGDWPSVARSLLNRVRRETVGRVTDEKTKFLMEQLLKYPGVDADWMSAPDLPGSAALPMIPIGFLHGGTTLSYFSLITTVGTPLSVAAQELRLESMYPVDQQTETLHLKLMNRRRKR